MSASHVVVVGAGVGGLSSALALAASGTRVTVLERQAEPGGKLREVAVGGQRMDAGPTVFTMRWVFDELFDNAGMQFEDHVKLKTASMLARHGWTDGTCLDLFADRWRSADSIAAFAGPREGKRFIEFMDRARRVYQTLETPFMRQACGSPQALVRAVGLRGLGGLMKISPFETLWQALGQHFDDPRLRQLFGRYATYCGSSPFLAPATLMLVAHVEQEGVWLVEGGMHQLAVALAGAAASRGAAIRYRSEVRNIVTERGRVSGVELASGERIEADAVIVNADAAAVSEGLFGTEAARALPPMPAKSRSLSAITWNLLAATDGIPLLRHNVFFSKDYAAEFAELFGKSRTPKDATVYVCAQDRDAGGNGVRDGQPERLMCLINAPAIGDTHAFDAPEIHACETRTFKLLERCGLQLKQTSSTPVITTPADFNRLFPATGGALYGPASHGWKASFNRASSKTRLPGLYLAGGSIHPGPGVPMAALSGRIAASQVQADLASTSTYRTVAMRGGMSMP